MNNTVTYSIYFLGNITSCKVMLAWTKSVIAEAFCFIVYYVEFTECLAGLRVALREDVVYRQMSAHGNACYNKQTTNKASL